jgi:hypothetical protein
MKKLHSPGPRAESLPHDLDALLHPARTFARPGDVVANPDLTLDEKRAILASWASDACAVEVAPALRCPPGGMRPVSVDAILDALRDLDKAAAEPPGAAWLRRRLRRPSIEGYRARRPRGGDNSGNPMST